MHDAGDRQCQVRVRARERGYISSLMNDVVGRHGEGTVSWGLVCRSGQNQDDERKDPLIANHHDHGSLAPVQGGGLPVAMHIDSSTLLNPCISYHFFFSPEEENK